MNTYQMNVAQRQCHSVTVPYPYIATLHCKIINHIADQIRRGLWRFALSVDLAQWMMMQPLELPQ